MNNQYIANADTGVFDLPFPALQEQLSWYGGGALTRLDGAEPRHHTN
jgi:hypothetical protein